jgi:ABC-type amino acid transport substrate-binding protein
MKTKLISLLLMTAMVTTFFVGCGSTKEDAEEQSDTTTDATTDATTESADESADESVAGDDFRDSLKGVTLTIGTSGTYAPFSYFAEDGKTLQGYDLDFITELQKLLGFEIADSTIQDMDYTPLGTSLSQGQLDVGIAALCATDERKKNMNFSETYFDAGIVVAVGEDNDTITSVDDLTNGDYTVAIQTGTIAYEYAVANLPESCLQTYDSVALAYKAVETGQADATIYDYVGTAYSIKTGEIKLKIVGDEFYTGQAPYAVAFSFAICEEYPDIIDNFNAAIDYLQEQGTLDELKAKWCE